MRINQSENREQTSLWKVPQIRAAAVAGALLLSSWFFGFFGGPQLIKVILEWLALFIAGWTFVPITIKRLFQKKIGVGTLMTLAAIGAVALGKVEDAAILSFLSAISEGLEEYSLAKTRRGLRALLDLVPTEATVIRNGQEFKIALESLVPGDRMIVKPGERFASDCRIIIGKTSLDTSALTGESLPVEAGPGSGVYAGTINGTGPLEVEVTTTVENNSLAKIVHIVETEQARKGPSQRLADLIASRLVPAVLIVAAAITVFGFIVGDPLLWFDRSLIVLVAASPCAIAISIPVTVVTAVGAATRMGVLIKGGSALEALGKIRTIALDKTGTLTLNKPVVIDVAAIASVDKNHVLEIAAGLESRSEHPLAQAIVAAAPVRATLSDVNTVPGAGVEGKFENKIVRLGRPGWINPGELEAQVTKMQQFGATAVLIEENGVTIGAIAVRDELRPEAKEVISRLASKGITTIMLTGDNAITAKAIADAAGIDRVHADLRPENKAEIIRTLKAQQPTAMVGDGVNDAPALATSDVGIAMGAMGADVAIETADIALMGDNLNNLPAVLDHAQKTRAIMLQNVSVTLLLIGALIPLSVFGVLGLSTVVLIHEVAEVLVIANGVRAGRLNKKQAINK